MNLAQGNLLAIFHAGLVHRWHRSPFLAHTVDRLDGHQGRVARIILMLHPSPSRALIFHALTHDDGESATGDVPSPAKKANPILRRELEIMEDERRAELWGADDPLSQSDQLWFHFADKLDAFMWAKHHRAPMDGDGWPEAREWLALCAVEFGREREVLPLLGICSGKPFEVAA
ncbi:MAG: YfbR-like 5'-deoxynucleotidase [Fuscovulum sp.]|nr:MAG: YfbR-like 5'-deoxynucleotidase [Fuscovulum sp.]